MPARIFAIRFGGKALFSPAFQFREQPQWLSHRHPLHTSCALRASEATHYETLGLEPNASQGDVKKKYYQLSKSTHPDRNPNDPNASARFAAVSDAYATLGNAEKRARYDRDVLRQQGTTSGRSGSYSSSQMGPNGSRPASGLSKRRSTFRGPPPSFYQAGGYGAYGNRASQAEANAESARRQAGTEYDGGGWTKDTSTAGGFSPGQGAQRGFDNDVPHFDREGHYRTQETVVNKTTGRKKRLYREYAELENGTGMSQGSSFILVSTVVGLAIVVPSWLLMRGDKQKGKRNS